MAGLKKRSHVHYVQPHNMSAEQKYEHVADTFQSELDDSRSNAGHKYDLFTAVRWLKNVSPPHTGIIGPRNPLEKAPRRYRTHIFLMLFTQQK